MERKTVSVGNHVYGNNGIRGAELMVREGLGDLLLYNTTDPEQLRKVCAYCRENHLKLRMGELISRMTGEWEKSFLPHFDELIAVLRENRDILDGALILGEFSGVRFYWPESSVCEGTTKSVPVSDFAAAEEDVYRPVRHAVARYREKGVPGPYVSDDASGLGTHFYLRGGASRVDAEMIYSKDSEMMYAGVKGASRAFGASSFGVDLATFWYGGNVHDDLWYTRWRTSLYHAFLRGADPIWSEIGSLGFKALLGADAEADSPEIVRFRKVLTEFADFVRKHPRAKGFPEAAVAVMQGHLDGYVGMGQTHLWGQRGNDRFRIGVPESSWAFYNTLYRRRGWENTDRTGDSDFSGNPPLGQADIIPWDTPDEVLASYKLVIFLGRNSMNDALYEKLLRYVENGGQLLLTTAHLDASIVPDGAFEPYRGGDWHELCGVRLQSERVLTPFGVKFRKNPDCGWSFPLWTSVCDPKYPGFGFHCADLKEDGAEILAAGSDRFNEQDPGAPNDTSDSSCTFNSDYESRVWAQMKDGMVYCKKIGKGYTVLINSLDYPGAAGMQELYSVILNAACDANRPYPRVEASDRIRYAVYPGTPRTLYLLNTEEKISQQAIVHWRQGTTETFTLKAGELLELPVKTEN